MKKFLTVALLSVAFSSSSHAMNLMGQGTSRNVEMSGTVTAWFYADRAPVIQVQGYIAPNAAVVAVHSESYGGGYMTKTTTVYEASPVNFSDSFDASDWGGDNGQECTPPDGKIY